MLNKFAISIWAGANGLVIMESEFFRAGAVAGLIAFAAVGLLIIYLGTKKYDEP